MKRIQCLMALAAVLACALPLQAQTGTVSGRVTDAGLMSALPDATITVAGVTVLSDAQGYYSVANVPAGMHTLRATLIGYRPFEMQVTVLAGETAVVAVRMQVAPMEMEPIVAIGYGETETRDLTGVVAEVPSETFNTGRVVSAEELIRGKVAGVQVTEANRAEPGGGISIRIRGGTSVTASNEPLYVIDGIVIPVGGGLSSGRNPLNFLNPADIESFTILKDASATAIYGSQGANGVVLIETTAGRRAAASGAQVTYTGNVSGSNVAARPDVLNANQFRDIVIAEQPGKLPLLGSANTDWQREIERGGFGQEHNLAVGGGTDKMNFRVSLGYLNQKGVIEASETERMSLNFAYSQLLFDDRLSLQANILGARNNDVYTPGSVIGAASQMAPTQPIYDENSPYGGYFEWDDPIATNNPLAELNLSVVEGTTYRSIGNVTGEYSIPKLDGLSVTARFGYNVTNSERREFYPTDLKSQVDSDFPPGQVNRSNPSALGWQFDSFLTYRTAWDQHGLDLTGGYAYYQAKEDTPFLQAYGLNTNLLGVNGIPSSEQREATLFTEEARVASWFGRANYSFKDRYLLTGSVRTDGSSKFGAGNQWAVFPSFAGAWRISEESFMDGGPFSDLKLRVSWGKNGNSAFDSYQQYKTYVFGDAFVRAQFGDEFVPTVRPSGTDPNIKWESTASWNFGLDYGFSDNRFWGSLEYYTKKTDDLIFTVPVAQGSNLSNQVTTNIGSMKNDGFEATLNAMLFEGSGDGFSWDANFNVAYNRNEITEINPFTEDASVEQILVGGISGGVGRTIQVLTPGESINSFYVWEHKRDASGKPIYEDVNGDGSINEQDLYVDRDGVPGITEDDKYANNNPLPDWIIGHTSLMRYRNLDFSFTLLAQIGNYVYNNVASAYGNYRQLVFSAAPANMQASVLDYGFDVPQYDSDVYVEDASFLRLENIEVGYTFNRWLNGVRIYGVVQNAFTITGYSGVDPTAGIDGIDNNLYPRTRTFTAGLNVTL